MNPNQIGNQTEAIFNVTNTTGKNLINDFANSINSLKSHWKGTDAVANLNDLAKVYTAVTDLVKKIQQIIVSVNNNDIIPLQKHIVSSGGTCTIGKELSVSLTVDSNIAVPTQALESWTDEAIISDAQIFNSFPEKFDKFISELNEAKDLLLQNWKEGSNRAQFVGLFNNFNQNVPDYRSNVIKVRDNLNTVAENKRKFL